MKENNNGNDTNVGSIENSIKESIERLKLCSTNQCHICGRYEKEECMLERNRCEQHILSDYKRALKENEEFRNFLEKIIREYIPDYELEQLIDRYKNESFIPKVEVKKILEDRRK